jgi:hypothetical protein
MAKEKAASAKQGRFARWRDRRRRNKLRASEMEHRMYAERFRDGERTPPGPGGG